MKGVLRAHRVPLAIFVVLTLVFLYSALSTTHTMSNIHLINDMTFIAANVESAKEHGEIHLWTPYYYSGRPLYAQPEYQFLDIAWIFFYVFGASALALNLAHLVYFLLAGLSMYVLAYHFSKNPYASCVAGITYLFGGYLHSFVLFGNLNVLAGYALIPLAFFLFVKACQSKHWLWYASGSGAVVALQLFAGATLLIPYEMVLFGLYAVVVLISKNPVAKAIKVALVGAIAGVVAFGLSAIKLLPGLEFMRLSNRSAGVSYQEYLGKPIEWSDLFHVLLSNEIGSGMTAAIGILGFILCLLSLQVVGKRVVLFGCVGVIVGLLLSTESFLTKLLFDFPVFSQLRHVERGLFIVAVCLPLLASIGYLQLEKRMHKWVENKHHVFVGVVIILCIELLFFQTIPWAEVFSNPEDVPLHTPLIQDTDEFRTLNLALSSNVGASGYNYLSQVDIETVKGGSGIWFNEYLLYLGVAQQQFSPLLWGVLNTKYLITKEPVNNSDLELVQEFESCLECPIWEVHGPYLYENKKVLPRAYTLDHAVLVLGAQGDVQQRTLQFMLQPSYDPHALAFIHEIQGLSSYSLSDLNSYRAVILASQPTSEDVSILQNYVNSGGTLLPNIFDSQNTITEQEIQELYNVSSSLERVEFQSTQNTYTYDTKERSGFLVLSERFSQFPGWRGNGVLKQAQGAISAVPLQGQDQIILSYSPDSYKRGQKISLITMLVLLGGIGYMVYRRKK